MKPICYAGIYVFARLASLLWSASFGIDEAIRSGLVCFLTTSFAIVLAISIYSGSSSSGLSKEFPLQFRLAAQFRTPILMFIVIPLSFIRWFHTFIQDVYRYRFAAKDTSSHSDRVNDIVQQIKKWNDDGRKSKLRTARPNWASMSTKLNSNKGNSSLIKAYTLNHILDVNFDNMTITCEPMVTMGQITHHLVPKGYALQIQVEMESITIGGVSMGFGMETNSHRIGFFQESVVAYELVSSEGNIIKVTAKSDPELFYALPWSCGTIGFLTSVTVRITKIKPFVHVKYIPTYNKAELAKKMKELSESDNAPGFLEATIYSKDCAVIQVGEYSDCSTAEEKKMVNGINWWWRPFYYKWVETFLEKGPGEELIPIMHYYHRFTRSIFWELEDMIPFSNHWLYRALWGWMGAPEVSLLKLFQGSVIRKASVYAHVVQESIMPVAFLEEGVDKFDEWYGVYPLLVFPLRVYDRGHLSGFLHPQKQHLIKGKNYGIWVDLGAYGAPRKVKEGKPWDTKSCVRDMEHWTRDHGGFQAYYTDLFCTRREFRQMFDHTLVDKCRERFNATDAFPEIYDKVRPEAGIVDLSEEEAAEKKAGNEKFIWNK